MNVGLGFFRITVFIIFTAVGVKANGLPHVGSVYDARAETVRSSEREKRSQTAALLRVYDDGRYFCTGYWPAMLFMGVLFVCQL